MCALSIVSLLIYVCVCVLYVLLHDYKCPIPCYTVGYYNCNSVWLYHAIHIAILYLWEIVFPELLLAAYVTCRSVMNVHDVMILLPQLI